MFAIVDRHIIGVIIELVSVIQGVYCMFVYLRGFCLVRPKTHDAWPLGALPLGTFVCCVEKLPGEGARIATSAGTQCQLVHKVFFCIFYFEVSDITHIGFTCGFQQVLSVCYSK